MCVCALIDVEPLSCFSDIAELKQKIHMLNLLVLLLPEPNRNTLKVTTQSRRARLTAAVKLRYTLTLSQRRFIEGTLHKEVEVI